MSSSPPFFGGGPLTLPTGVTGERKKRDREKGGGSRKDHSD